MSVNNLNMPVVDLLDYLHDIKEYLDKFAQPQKYCTRDQELDNKKMALEQASNMVQFLIDKINKKED